MDFTAQKHEALLDTLRRHVDGEVRFDAVARKLYSTDASIYQIEPVGVVIPKTTTALQSAVQIALEMHIPIIPRGGGTSLSGQSIGAGIVLDCSKYLNNVLDIDADHQVARVQPGVILDQFNRALAPHNLQFGPDVATASRANLGGMIGNNSAGSHSIVHGKTIDHVRKLRVLLSDGKPHDLGPADWQHQDERAFLGSLHRRVRQIVSDNADEIRRRFPRILRRVSGYNLDVFVEYDSNRVAPPTRLESYSTKTGLHQLIVGSEGTLGVILEAELNLVPKPKVVGLLIPQFSTLAAAMDALALCLEMQPSAVELMDHMLIELARRNLSLRDTAAALTGTPDALLMVEFSGDDFGFVTDRIKKLQAKLQGLPGLIAMLPAIEATARQPLWNLRNAAVPLLLGIPGDRKPVTFIEDTAVAPEVLPRYVARFREILKKHGTDGSFYGHASVGCLHIRPVLNIKEPADLTRMRRITEDITDLVLEFGGSLSGEHGDGLARSEWNRKMFGDVVYNAFCQVKDAFDPYHLFNPGKIVHAPAMTENLRYGAAHQPAAHAARLAEPKEPATLFDYSKQEGFTRSIEMCNGSGVCRKLQGGTMCPSFRATKDEKDSTRGRANILRLALAGEKPLETLAGDDVNAVLDLCLMCKACKSECPSNVDLAKLKAEVMELRYKDRPRPWLHRMLSQLHRVNRWSALAAPLVNLAQRNRLVRWMLHHFVGIDQRRSLPDVYFNHFRRWFARRKAPGTKPNVILLDDCFTTYNEPAIGQAAVRVLDAAGLSIELAGLNCCGRTLISKGYLSEARKLIQEQAPRLAARVASGLPILGLEPSCLLTLVDEWPELLPGPATTLIAKSAQLADGWLAQQVRDGRIKLHLSSPSSVLGTQHSALVHGHCHQKALVGMAGTAALLKLVPGLDLRILDTGCCGMAGSFGFETAHYDLSVQIAELDLLPALARQPEALVVAPGTSCRHQIHDLAKRRALHPLEVIDAALEREPKS